MFSSRHNHRHIMMQVPVQSYDKVYKSGQITITPKPEIKETLGGIPLP